MRFGVFIYDGVEPIDLAAFGVLSMARRVVTGGGVTLCIDVVLHLLERLFDARVAAETARILEYTTAWHANRQAFRAVVG